MKTEYQIILIIFIHWIADFLLQTRKMATNKSTDNYWLLIHVFVYSTVWFFIGIFLYEPIRVILFSITTFIFHFITDYLTSRTTTKLYKKQNYYGFFSVIGFDQFLHYLQLIICYEFFSKL